MEYVKRFLQVEGVVGQGAFGRVLLTSSLQNQSPAIIRTPPPNHPPSSSTLECIKKNLSNINNNSNNNTNQTKIAGQQQSKQLDRINSNASLTSPTKVTRFALKCVHPILRPHRLASELRCLRDLNGLNNVVKLYAAHFNMGSLFIVMELIEHDRFVDIVAQLDHREIVEYMKNLLIALKYIHDKEYVHRDIKPANFLFSRKSGKFLLVDFGLAQKLTIRSQPANKTLMSSSILANGVQYSSKIVHSPKTPTATRRSINAPLFPESLNDKRKEQLDSIIPDSPYVNPKSAHQIVTQSPARLNQMNFSIIGSPSTPNVSTKRQLPVENCNQMLKKLRVSNDEIREPVRLTVGAYESPITNNDCSNRTRSNANNNHKFSTPKVPRRPWVARCDCRGKPKTCNICLTRPDSNASRSGTPGFKAPEILLRCPYQTTAIDIWSAGVIFVCLLAGHSPFFRDIEDSVSLGEIITIFGSQRITQAAKALGIRLDVEPKREPIDLKALCKAIRFNRKDKVQIDIPDSAFDLLYKMLDPNPLTRITAKDALTHHWIVNHSPPN